MNIPAIISYDLRKSYSPGEACSLRAEGTNAGYALDLNLRVVGVLYEYGGLMNLAVWQYVTNPNLINNLYWNNLKSTLNRRIHRGACVRGFGAFDHM